MMLRCTECIAINCCGGNVDPQCVLPRWRRLAHFRLLIKIPVLGPWTSISGQASGWELLWDSRGTVLEQRYRITRLGFHLSGVENTADPFSFSPMPNKETFLDHNGSFAGFRASPSAAYREVTGSRQEQAQQAQWNDGASSKRKRPSNLGR